jgi:hypothetical protein
MGSAINQHNTQMIHDISSVPKSIVKDPRRDAHDERCVLARKARPAENSTTRGALIAIPVPDVIFGVPRGFTRGFSSNNHISSGSKLPSRSIVNLNSSVFSRVLPPA